MAIERRVAGLMFREQHDLDRMNGSHSKQARLVPAGGYTEVVLPHGQGACLSIHWQDGPLGRGEERQEPNGAFVEHVLAAAIGRLEFYQSTDFRCRENALAITKLQEALHWLQHRTAEREARGVEGTHAL